LKFLVKWGILGKETARKGGEGGRGYVHDISRLDDQAPSGPDQACAGQGHVLCEGELLRRAVEVRDAGEDETPLL